MKIVQRREVWVLDKNYQNKRRSNRGLAWSEERRMYVIHHIQSEFGGGNGVNIDGVLKKRIKKLQQENSFAWPKVEKCFKTVWVDGVYKDQKGS